MVEAQTLLLLWAVRLTFTFAYYHKPCNTRSLRGQFPFPDCYLPDMDPSLLLSDASFVLSHDAGTGYLQTGASHAIVNSYAKNQIGSAYDQLNDGARALDTRLQLMTNGTIMLHHGAIHIPVTLETFVQDVMRWCGENTGELVLILHSGMMYENANMTNDGGSTAVSALSELYSSLGVTYGACEDVYGLSVGDALEFGALQSGGSLIAIDRHDYFTSTCAKSNWVKPVVTCYNNGTLPCTTEKSKAWEMLEDYVLQSANNPATDDTSTLGPPANIEKYPFNEIQGIWQVTTASAIAGVAHLSTIIDDNTKSRVNAKLVNLVYEGAFKAISLMAVDHVQLNGNALLSVLRTACGQTELSESECGRNAPKPRIRSKPMSLAAILATIAVVAIWGAGITVLARRHLHRQRAGRQLTDDADKMAQDESTGNYGLMNDQSRPSRRNNAAGAQQIGVWA